MLHVRKFRNRPAALQSTLSHEMPSCTSHLNQELPKLNSIHVRLAILVPLAHRPATQHSGCRMTLTHGCGVVVIQAGACRQDATACRHCSCQAEVELHEPHGLLSTQNNKKGRKREKKTACNCGCSSAHDLDLEISNQDRQGQTIVCWRAVSKAMYGMLAPCLTC